MQELLESYVDGTLAANELSLDYHIGDEFSGETQLVVWGDGRYRLWSTVTAGRKHWERDGRLDAEAVKSLAQTLLETRIWEVSHPNPRPGEDDPEAKISAEAAGRRQEVVLWVSELPQCPSFAQAQRAFLDLVHSLSEGVILEGGR